MLHATLKIVHLLSLIVWLGGMYFVLACLRPSLDVLEGPARVRLMQATLGRFLAAVALAAALSLVSGVWLLGRAMHGMSRAGVSFAMPLDWWIMLVLGIVMLLVFLHVRLVLYRRVVRAAAAQAWPDAAAALAGVRNWVLVNLCLGVLIVVATQLGAVS